ncbi:MAG: DUF3137 domain-containing protein [Lentisphaerae bacterium]|nr:DUF3137 domain-containing protein [Lentisphaerota bacterium]
MEEKQTFEQFFQTELVPALRPLEERRKGVVQKAMISCGAVVLAAVFIALFLLNQAGSILVLAFPAIIGIAISVFIFKAMTSGYVRDFKNQVVGPIVRYVGPQLTYRPESGISEGQFQSSGIFHHSIDRYHCEDLVQGPVDKTRIAFSELHAEYKTETRDSKGHRQTHWHTIFKGLFFVADFNKHFHGKTYILPDTAEKMFGRFGQKLQGIGKSHGELVKLEDPVFEKEFAVYSSDQVEARYILSPALMRRMLELRRKAGSNVYFSFCGGNVNIAISSNKDRFEPKLFNTVLDIELAREFVDDLQSAIGVVDELNLNTRIWTKE